MDALPLFAEGKILRFPNKKEVNLDYKALSVFLLDSILIVVLEIPVTVIDNTNVVAYNIEGKFLWRIDTTDKKLFGEQINCPFIGANTTEGGKSLLLYNWCDATLLVDHHTGNILERYQAH